MSKKYKTYTVLVHFQSSQEFEVKAQDIEEAQDLATERCNWEHEGVDIYSIEIIDTVE